jgi:Sulfatase
VRRLPAPWRHLWPLPFAGSGLLVGLLLSDALYRPQGRGIYVALSVAFAVALTVMALVDRLPRPRLRAAALLFIALAAATVDVYTPRMLYRELHDLASLVVAGCALAGFAGLRRRLGATGTPFTLGALALLSAGAWLELATVDNWAPGWRATSLPLTRYQSREARAVRALVDFDGDGYSPLAWGGDCDDFDANRNPAHQESRKFRDANCNGIVPPEQPSDEQRGLAPAAGTPDAEDIDLVLLVTIDCWRKDAFRPDVMPHLWEWARHNLLLSRLYTGGSRTKWSLPLVMRGSDDGTPLPVRLKKAGVRPMALFGYTDPQLNYQVLAGFDEKYVPAHARWKASDLTNLALAKIHSTVGERRFLWIHYFDAHYPYYPPAEYPPGEVPPGFPDAFGKYLANLSYVDTEFARLRDRLKEDGSLGRTMIIVTADHGEGFGQHGVPLHGISAYDMLVHVQGILSGPGVNRGEYSGLVSHRDIPATVLGAFGLVHDQPDVESFGRSWLRLRAAPSAPLHRFVVTRSARAASGYDYSTPMTAIIEGDLKLIETFEDHLAELYDPVHDPLELRNLLTQLPLDAARLDDDLQMYRDIDR